MNSIKCGAGYLLLFASLLTPLSAADRKVDLSKEKPGSPPTTFEPMVGTWVVALNGTDKVIMVDGRPWVAGKDNPSRLLIESARKLYGTSNEELMDNAKQFAYYPVALLKGVEDFSGGTISVKFKTMSGESDRCSGILFNVKTNGDWLAVRYNDTENNVALWEFHSGLRRPVKFSDRTKPFMLDRNAWHDLKMTVDGSSFKAWLDGTLALDYTLGSEPGPGRNGGPPNPDLFPANNPVLRPPVSGRIGLWSKTDSTSYFKDYIVSSTK
jgi:hypothetical protein